MIGEASDNTIKVRPHHYETNLFLFYFYYEPSEHRDINKITIEVVSTGSSLYDIGYVDSSNTFHQATNVKIDGTSTPVPVDFPSNSVGHTFTFDNINVGPGTPMKFVLRNTSDFMAIRRIY